MWPPFSQRGLEIRSDVLEGVCKETTIPPCPDQRTTRLYERAKLRAGRRGVKSSCWPYQPTDRSPRAPSNGGLTARVRTHHTAKSPLPTISLPGKGVREIGRLVGKSESTARRILKSASDPSTCVPRRSPACPVGAPCGQDKQTPHFDQRGSIFDLQEACHRVWTLSQRAKVDAIYARERISMLSS